MGAASAIDVVRTLDALRARIAEWRRSGARIGLVPTMGALHEGHMALVRRALAAGERVVASIFVNPTQFAPTEDFAAYPRDEAADLAALADGGAHLAWIPSMGEMYPAGFATRVTVGGPSQGLDGDLRPGHFEGVATVVAKLLLQVRPDSAYFGEKDYQQLLVVQRLARDLDLPVRIEGVPTVRGPDGLALSSRNRYLGPNERVVAAALPRILAQAAASAVAGEISWPTLLANARNALMEAGFDAVDYIEVRDAETLGAVTDPKRPLRLLGAARLGRTRLIDNLPIGLPADGVVASR